MKVNMASPLAPILTAAAVTVVSAESAVRAFPDNTYGWDPDMLVAYASGNSQAFYYSTYPNNTFIAVIAKTLAAPFIDTKAALIQLAIIATLIGVVATIATVWVLWENLHATWVAAITVTVLVGCSYWAIVPYTDQAVLATGTCAMFCAAWAYKRAKAHTRTWWLIGAGVFAIIAGACKPTALAVAAGITLTSVLVARGKKRLIPLGVLAGITASVFGVTAISNVVMGGVDTGQALPAAHWFAMGQSARTGGNWDQFMVEAQLATVPDQRRTVALEQARTEISDRGLAGEAGFTVRKLARVYGYGEFGAFTENPMTAQATAESLVCEKARHVWDWRCIGHTPWRIVRDVVWAVVCVAALVGVVVGRRRPEIWGLATIVGVYACYMALCEARARMVWWTVPFMILLATYPVARFRKQATIRNTHSGRKQ